MNARAVTTRATSGQRNCALANRKVSPAEDVGLSLDRNRRKQKGDDHTDPPLVGHSHLFMRGSNIWDVWESRA
jgi:hypothetical protein